jgi:hypothetical protein
VTSNAAISKANLKFISLIGEAPVDIKPPYGNFVGCCHLGSHSAIRNIIDFLLKVHSPTKGAPEKVGTPL